MKLFILLAFVFILSGCVIYPARHVSEPRYEVSISGESFSSVQITSSLDASDGACEGGKVLNLESSAYIAEAEYGWIKVAFMVPVDSHKPIKICAFGEDDREYFWAKNIGVFGSEYPKLWKFKCEVVKGVLSCEKTT